jgi:Dyp-type peroxidase family
MDRDDIQGLVLQGYRRHPFAAYVLVRFAAGQGPRAWVATLVADGGIDSATAKDVGPPGRPGIRLNIAFTYSGLDALGVGERTLRTFPLEFVDGLGRDGPNPETPHHRSRVLGDVDESAPEFWGWGYQSNDPARSSAVDALLLVFATSPAELQTEVDRWIQAARQTGAIDREPRIEYGRLPVDVDDRIREPFGFADGFSQPQLRGAGGRRAFAVRDVIEDGEMLLGHRDNTRQIAASPTVPIEDDAHRILPPAGDNRDGPRDFGRNGTFLVYRQLAQDVDQFQAVCAREANRLHVDTARFEALLVGRWQDGAPLITSPIQHDPAQARPATANAFTYETDLTGERCPIGAHIRRSNPRDSLGDDPEESWRVTRRHRIIRRGRPYVDANGGTGLHFICLNADIARQFEFIQQNWINDPTFGGLTPQDDPIVGSRRGLAAAGRFTVPQAATERVHAEARGLPRFVTVRGGAYFFLPSLTTLRYLAGLGRASKTGGATTAPRATAVSSRSDRLRALYLARFPLLLAAALALTPLMISGGSPLRPLTWPMFHVTSVVEMAGLVMFASLAAAVALATFRIVYLHAKVRFDVNVTAPRLTGATVFAWQAFTLPIVVTIVWLSALDASPGASVSWRQIARFSGAALIGYLAALVVLVLAAAMRQRAVRDDNPVDEIFLPSNALFARLKTRPTLTTAVSRAVVRFVESRAQLWPEGRGAGYVDRRTGRVLPGHLAGLGLFAALCVVYELGWYLLRPPYPWVGFQLPPLAYLLFLLLGATLIAAGLAFLFDRYRIPLLTLLFLWLLWGWRAGDTDSQFPVRDTVLASAPTIAHAISEADRRHRASGVVESNPDPDPVIVVTAGGGGAHQAAWTARVLTGLTELWGRRFTDRLRLVSAVSGGSVGAMPFVNAFTPEGLPLARLDAIRTAPLEPATADIWWGIAYPDTLRVVLPVPLRRRLLGSLDRGWALEQAWNRAAPPAERAATMASWQGGVAAGWRPAVAFNATVVETGQRAVLATYAIPDTTAAMDLGTLTGHKDVTVATAARLSASFPYVTPFPRPSNAEGDRRLHLADGGYWDNHGTVTALEWLEHAGPSLAGHPVLVIQISPPSAPDRRGGDRSWVWQLLAPWSTLESVRTDAQRARNQLEQRWLQGAAGVPVTHASIRYTHDATSLSWHLTKREQCEIERVWNDEYAVDPSRHLGKLIALLGPVVPQGRFPQGCRP